MSFTQCCTNAEMFCPFLQRHLLLLNDTGSRHVRVDNVIVRIQKSKRHKCVCLSLAIIPEDISAASEVTVILQAFCDGLALLGGWKRALNVCIPSALI